jgi:hypothetical protein
MRYFFQTGVFRVFLCLGLEFVLFITIIYGCLPFSVLLNDLLMMNLCDEGISASMESTTGESMPHPLDEIEPKKDIEPENCPFWWARSPENILQQDTYLALATCFVILRLLYLLYPKIVSAAKLAWRRHTRFPNLMGVHEYFFTYLEQARQKFNRLYSSKRGNLQEGARSATAWASKSLASVSIGEPSTIGRTNSTNELR